MSSEEVAMLYELLTVELANTAVIVEKHLDKLAALAKIKRDKYTNLNQKQKARLARKMVLPSQ